eukprot:TRINITY_DN9703_c0_g1_i1.p2 TRINITY_DN9703_c0_g1~~TRINITY_DN9703_c0_g1_i1.p2  ORF type:complete len:478 (-),score=90.49 TRINITY_DN9703_c0_g1_i1:48-1481(-)
MDKKTIASIFIATFVAIITYQNDYSAFNQIRTREQSIFNYYQSIYLNTPSPKKVAIGYNTNLDLIISGKTLLRTLGLQDNSRGTDRRVDDVMSVASLDDLLDLYVNYFEQGSAVERFIDDVSVCDAIMDAALSLREKNLYVGGNAGLMARELVSMGSQVVLAGPVGPRLAEQFQQDGDNLQLVKLDDKDEIHLIMEYGANEKFGKYVSPRANRVIVHCDVSNAKISAMDEFNSKIKKHEPDTIILAGLHLLESEGKDVRKKQLDKVLSFISNDIDRTITKVHFELASVSDLLFLKDLGTVISKSDSLGLNEQELGYLYFSIMDEDPVGNTQGKRKIKSEFKDPTVDNVIEAIGYLMTKLDDKLTKVHYHSLKFHMIATRADNTGVWEDPVRSLVAGAYIASAKSCMVDQNSDIPSLFDVRLDERLYKDANRFGVQEFTHRIVKNGIVYDIAPVLVCKNPLKTVGLGDAISSVGIFYS